VIADGICGTATISIGAARSGTQRKFVNWISGRTTTGFPPPLHARRKPGHGGYHVVITIHGQSLERNICTACHFARALAAIGGLEEVIVTSYVD